MLKITVTQSGLPNLVSLLAKAEDSAAMTSAATFINTLLGNPAVTFTGDLQFIEAISATETFTLELTITSP